MTRDASTTMVSHYVICFYFFHVVYEEFIKKLGFNL